MVTLRMIGIALAILLLFPLGIALGGPGDVPGGNIAEYGGEIVAYVTDLELVSPPPTKIGSEQPLPSEQLVEGHTVFATMDIRNYYAYENGTLNVTGDIHCEKHVDTPVRYWPGGIPLPYRIDRAGVECTYEGKVIATPDPFYDSPTLATQPFTLSPKLPTGRVWVGPAPTGETTYTEEYVYVLTYQDENGDTHDKTLYCWVTNALQPWTDNQGNTRSFWMPIPEDRLAEMDLRHFDVKPHDPETEG